ncbi:MAG: glycosyltransferase family 4 protein [Deltaproteobacteria bacterium]|nr:glycosyltransferase family 4 protein [Deltaproteobacteria bacterium]
MNILFVSGIYPPDIGGPATYVSRMAYELKNRGHFVQVLTLGQKGENIVTPFQVKKVKKGKNILLRCLRMIVAGIHLAKKPDIIYATGSPWDSWFISVVIARLLKSRLIFKVVGDAVWEWAQRTGISDMLMEDFNEYEGNTTISILKKFRSYMARKADRIITPSDYLKRVVEQWGIQGDKIKIIFNAVENPFDAEVLHCQRRREVITVARLVPWKGVDGLIKVARLLPADSRLIIIGDGPLLGSLRGQVKHDGLEDKVEFTGRLAKDDVLKRLMSASVFVLNSRYEGFPHAVLEAMSAGAAVVVTNAGGNNEIVRDGENGFLVPIGDERMMAERVNILLENNTLRCSLAAEARRGLIKTSWPKIISQTEEALSDVLN